MAFDVNVNVSSSLKHLESFALVEKWGVKCLWNEVLLVMCSDGDWEGYLYLSHRM
jgi:hypothetical protein